LAAADYVARFVGDAVKSVNPTLLSSPPPSTEESGHDVCYLGLESFSVVYCRDLPAGQRAMVGSWYLSPERHAMECLAFVTVSCLVVRAISPRLSTYPTQHADKLVPPLLIKIATAFFYACQLVYKSHGYKGKILFMAMPCNMLWSIWALLCFGPLTLQTRHVMYQLIIPYTSLAIVAIATPDVSDLKMWMEVPFFFLMHGALLAYPLYFLASGRISVLPLDGSVVSNFLIWWLLSCAYFALFYFGVGLPLSLVSGINLNYMLSPPPSPGDVISGPNFRLQSTLCCTVAFFLIQFLATALSVLGSAVNKSFWISPKKCA